MKNVHFVVHVVAHMADRSTLLVHHTPCVSLLSLLVLVHVTIRPLSIPISIEQGSAELLEPSDQHTIVSMSYSRLGAQLDTLSQCVSLARTERHHVQLRGGGAHKVAVQLVQTLEHAP